MVSGCDAFRSAYIFHGVAPRTRTRYIALATDPRRQPRPSRASCCEKSRNTRLLSPTAIQLAKSAIFRFP